jgi:hypothetical protein
VTPQCSAAKITDRAAKQNRNRVKVLYKKAPVVSDRGFEIFEIAFT